MQENYIKLKSAKTSQDKRKYESIINALNQRFKSRLEEEILTHDETHKKLACVIAIMKKHIPKRQQKQISKEMTGEDDSDEFDKIFKLRDNKEPYFYSIKEVF